MAMGMASSTTFVGASDALLLWNKPPPPVLSHRSAFFPTATRVAVVRGQGNDERRRSSLGKSSEEKMVAEGFVTESLPNGMFWVRLENGDVVLGYISGKIRRNSIRMLPGDKVKIEVSRYDCTRGRIVYRIGNKN